MNLPDYEFDLAKHNGVDIESYNSENYTLFPYPSFKAPFFNDDNLTTANRPYYKEDIEFIEVLNCAEQRWGNAGEVRDISWRLHLLLEHVRYKFQNTDSRTVVELGTGRGYMMTALAKSFPKEPIQGYLYDTFTEILDSEDSTDPDYISKKNFAYADGGKSFAGDLKTMLNAFSTSHNWQVCVGKLPDSIAKLTPPNSIDFLHIDLNHAESELSAFLALSHLVTQDTLIIFDDTGGPGNERQFQVHKQIADMASRSIMFLPTGQSVIM